MKNFSPALTKQLYSLLAEKYENVFIKSIRPSNEKRISSKNFESFILETLENNFEFNAEREDIQELSNIMVRNKNKMKKNWFNAFHKEIKEPLKVKESNKSILKEVEVFEKIKDKEFKKGFGALSTDELIKKRIKEVEKWKKDKESRLIDYYYFEYKKPYQKLAAFNYDLCMEILFLIENYFDGTLSGYIQQRATELVDNAIFGFSRILMSLNITIDKHSNNLVVFNDYEVSENYVLRTIIKEPEKIKMINDWYILDERDAQIIDKVFEIIKPNFYTDKTIEIDIGDIVKRVYPSRNSHSYKDAESRVMKISLMQIQGLIKEKEDVKDTKFSINFFDHVIIETDPISNKRIAKIVVGAMLHDIYINEKTIKVASYQYKKLKSSLSKLLFYPLQKERLKMSVSNENEKYVGEYNYLFFRYKVRFKSRKKAENMKLIEESLEEFAKENFLIKRYKRTSDSFLIEFYPLTKEEKEDFGISSNLNKKLSQ